MQNSQLNRALNLVKRTGDKLVIFDRDTDAGYALMNLDKYEDLLNDAEIMSDDFDPDRGGEHLDEGEFYAPRPTTTRNDFSAIGSVMKDRWRNPVSEDETESESKIFTEKNSWENEPEIPSISESEIEPETEPEIPAEEISLHDVPHQEEEETFLLEPVE